MLNCVCIIKFLPISVVLAWYCSGEVTINVLEPGFDPWLQTLFCLEGKDLFFFSQSLKGRNLNVKILNGIFLL